MKNLPAVFLDRDGVIIENRSSYVRSWEDVEFLPDVFDSLAQLSRTKYKVLIVTNQSAVGRGIISLRKAQTINKRIVAEIENHGGRIDRVFMCPHAPNEGCHCRKPQPGMILEAQSKMSVTLNSSLMIGDTINDLLAAERAGINNLGLVRTGLGTSEEQKMLAWESEKYVVFDDLTDALQQLIFT